MSDDQNKAVVVLDKYKNVPANIDSLLNDDKVLNLISSRAYDETSLAKFQTFDSHSLEKISEFMPVVNEKVNSFGRKNTNVTNKLMTLTMMTDGHPFRVVRQCLAQIETKRTALRENIKKLKEKKIDAKYMISDLKLLQEDLKNAYVAYEEYGNSEDNTDLKRNIIRIEKEIEKTEVELEDIFVSVSESRVYIEGALKEIASFQHAYKQVLKNKNLPEEWDEETFEKLECSFHTHQSILHAYRDIKVHGRLGMGTMEYLQQFGMFPEIIEVEVYNFINQTRSKMAKPQIDPLTKQVVGEEVDLNNPEIDVDILHEWLDEMEEKYGSEYKKTMKYIGLDSLSEDWYLYKKNKE